MNPVLNLWKEVTGHHFMVMRDGDDLVLEPTPFSRELPPGLISELKTHKPEILSLLRYQEEADTLLLESTRQLARAWPKGCELDSPKWQRLDKELHRAYWTLDRQELTAAIRAREAHALQVFEAHRKEKATS